MLIIETVLPFNEDQLIGKTVDFLEIEWFEATKRILRRKSKNGLDVAIKRKDTSELRHRDILWQNEDSALLLSILPCEAIKIDCKELFQTASLCYDIGNRHAPVFWESNTVYLPFDAPMFQMLVRHGYEPEKETRILQNMLKTNIPNHAHKEDSEGILTKILKKMQ